MKKNKQHKDKKKKNKGSETFNKKSLKKTILDIFAQHPTYVYNYKQIAKHLNVKDTSTKLLITASLHDLADSEQLTEVSAGKFKIKTQGGYITGIVDLTKSGAAYIVSEDMDEDVFVTRQNLNRALNGDEVKVHLSAKRKSKSLNGEVVQIIKQARSSYVGTIEISQNFAFLIADNSKMVYDIFIPLHDLNGAKHGEKAIVEIVEWPEHRKSPIGKITEIIGKPGENNTEMHAILAEYELPLKFSDKMEKAAQDISDEISEEEISKRRDFRDITTFTIDPTDAKDFDDALSLRKTESGFWEVGIHIADVTHYVKDDTVLDKEAFERATSVYLVDRVVPMLPERLSNDMCSLRPNEEKLCFSAVFELDDKGHINSQWFGRTIINSNKRFDYSGAQAVLDTGEGDFNTELLTLNNLAKTLREKRFKKGSIGFERKEVKFNLDKNGKPLNVYFKEAKEANHLIEEFMLLANKKVAEFIGKAKPGKKAKTFVYRVHDLPDPEKFKTFSKFLKRFGYQINAKKTSDVSTSLNKLLEEVKEKPEKDIVEDMAIRTMAKAEYTTENIGHYGLSFDYYTHFTSPIRRYPDMMVHRLLDKYLNESKSVTANKYEKMCKHSSEMERKAAFAERASVKYKQVEFMQDKIGEVFSGIISGITEWGIYVEIVENKIEGMVSLKDLDDDYYVFDDKNFCIKGQNTQNKYHVGDKAEIQIVRANLQKKQLDFVFYKE